MCRQGYLSKNFIPYTQLTKTTVQNFKKPALTEVQINFGQLEIEYLHIT
jgi:hypothetical protein